MVISFPVSQRRSPPKTIKKEMFVPVADQVKVLRIYVKEPNINMGNPILAGLLIIDDIFSLFRQMRKREMGRMRKPWE